MPNIALEMDRRGLDAVLAFGANLGRPLRVGVKRVHIHIANDLQRRIPRRSGKLAGGYQPSTGKDREWSLTSTRDSAEGLVTNKLIYAAMQEYGGIVRKKDKMLPVPLKAAKTPSGVSKVASPRQVPDLRFIVSKKSGTEKFFLAKVTKYKRVHKTGKRAGKRAKVEVWYRLMDEVEIPATHHVRDAVADARTKAVEIIEAAVDEDILRLSTAPSNWPGAA